MSGRFAAVFAVLFTGCASEPRFAADVEPLFRARCTGCHGGATPQGGLDLYADPLGVMVEQTSGQADLDLVKPGDSLYSYLFHKVNGSQALAGGAGGTMPLTGALSEEEIDLIAAWIDSGARP